jgi:hypothetical protein
MKHSTIYLRCRPLDITQSTLLKVLVSKLESHLVYTYIHTHIQTNISLYIQDVSKRALQLLKRIEICTEDTQRPELSKCRKTHRVLPTIVIRNCFDLFFRFLLHGTSTVTPTPKSNGPYRSHNNDHYAHD